MILDKATINLQLSGMLLSTKFPIYKHMNDITLITRVLL